MKKYLKNLFCCLCVLAVLALASCSNKDTKMPQPTVDSSFSSNASTDNDQIVGNPAIKLSAASDPYLVLVNKTHKLPDDWEQKVEIIEVQNSLGESLKIEKKAYEAFCKLREDLLKNDDVQIELDSVYRSVAEQEEMVEWFKQEYGEEYARTYAAVPGFSEHHTGLAVDIFVMGKDGVEIRENDAMIADVEDFQKIHSKLADYGFILRYLDGKDNITGYAYEPWHLRYINNVEKAQWIMEHNLTFEEYLNETEGGE